MNRADIYDNTEPWLTWHEKEYKKLPVSLQLAIQACQTKIQIEVEKAVIKEFGRKALADLKPTSGFRSYLGNKKAGGKINSGHLLGYCRDFSRCGIFRDKFINSNSVIRVVPSKGWHVELRK